jgi:hypothetical protein
MLTITVQEYACEPAELEQWLGRTGSREKSFSEFNRIKDVNASFFWRGSAVFSGLALEVNASSRKDGKVTSAVRRFATVAAGPKSYAGARHWRISAWEKRLARN